MLELLQYIFSSFWIWLGFTITSYLILRTLIVAVIVIAYLIAGKSSELTKITL